MLEPARPLDLRRSLSLALLLVFACFLFFQRGSAFDEAEHLHVAWLMAVRGQRPIHDFFEHHPPLLWYVLGLFFRLGAPGPESLYLARGLVVLCALGFAATLQRLGARLGGSGAPLAVSVLVFLGLVNFELLVTRPETLAVALLGLALLAWDGRTPARSTLAGALSALAVLASPRFLLLTPAFLLLAKPGALQLPPLLRVLLPAKLGGLLLLGLALATFAPLGDLLFDLRYSSALQEVGRYEANFVYLGLSLGVPLFVAGVLYATRAPPRRSELLLWAALGVANWLLCLLTAGGYLYAQAFAPALFFWPIFLAWLEAHPPRAQAEALVPGIAQAGQLGALAAVLVLTAGIGWTPNSAPDMAASRRVLLDALPPGSKVLVQTPFHPISVDDAGYWGAIVGTDTPTKMCLAAALYAKRYPQASIQLPPCSLLTDLRRLRPAAVSRHLFVSTTATTEELPALRNEIQQHYRESSVMDAAPNTYFAAQLLFRIPDGEAR